MYVHSFNVMKKNIQVLHLELTSYSDTVAVHDICWLTALAGHVFIFFFVSSWQNVLLVTPFAAGTTTEAIVSVLPGVHISVCLFVCLWTDFVSGLAFLNLQDTDKNLEVAVEIKMKRLSADWLTWSCRHHYWAVMGQNVKMLTGVLVSPLQDGL